MIYSKEDLKDLEVTNWVSLRHFLSTEPLSVSLVRSHLVLSRKAWQQITNDKEMAASIDPVIRHAQLLQGHIGHLVSGPALFTDAFDSIDTRVFAEDTPSYILVPPHRTKSLPDSVDPSTFLVND